MAKKMILLIWLLTNYAQINIFQNTSTMVLKVTKIYSHIYLLRIHEILGERKAG